MPSPDPIFDVSLINQRRDRWACQADAPDFLLRRISEDLSERISLIKRKFAKTALLGSHHGLVGQALAEHGAIDWIVSVDTSPALLSLSKFPKVCADQEWLPFQNGALDLVVSPLTMQYANDLPGMLIQIRRALKNDGLLLASLLGGETLTELRQAWLQAESELTDGAAPRVAPFADVRDLGTLLQRAGFALPVTDSERLTVTYSSPLALMQELKAMAASNPLMARSRRPVTKRLLKHASEIYVERFADKKTGRIPATIEVLTMSAWAPDESQPKPLRPGSAQVRLADALGVNEQILPENKSKI